MGWGSWVEEVTHDRLFQKGRLCEEGPHCFLCEQSKLGALFSCMAAEFSRFPNVEVWEAVPAGYIVSVWRFHPSSFSDMSVFLGES